MQTTLKITWMDEDGSRSDRWITSPHREEWTGKVHNDEGRDENDKEIGQNDEEIYKHDRKYDGIWGEKRTKTLLMTKKLRTRIEEPREKKGGKNKYISECMNKELLVMSP